MGIVWNTSPEIIIRLTLILQTTFACRNHLGTSHVEIVGSSILIVSSLKCFENLIQIYPVVNPGLIIQINNFFHSIIFSKVNNANALLSSYI